MKKDDYEIMEEIETQIANVEAVAIAILPEDRELSNRINKLKKRVEVVKYGFLMPRKVSK